MRESCENFVLCGLVNSVEVPKLVAFAGRLPLASEPLEFFAFLPHVMLMQAAALFYGGTSTDASRKKNVLFFH